MNNNFLKRPFSALFGKYMKRIRDRKDFEIIKKASGSLNKEAEDVLEYQDS